MANSCDIKNLYSKSDYSDVYFSALDLNTGELVATPEVLHELQRMYAPPIASAIYDAISNGTFTEDWDMKPGIQLSSVSPQFNFNGAKNSETETDELLAFYLNKDRTLEAKDQMATRFFEDVISKVLYDKSKGTYFNPTTSSINKALYDYKVELMKRLWTYTGVSYENDLETEDLTTIISKTLNDFNNKNNSYIADSLWDDYVILKNFNKLLKDYTPFIKLNAAFANTNYQSADMYVWDPSGTYRQSWTDSEDADISKYASTLIKMLAEYFTTADAEGIDTKIHIGFKMYNIAMSTVATWIHENKNDVDVKTVSDDLRKNGLNADFGRMIDVYVQKAKVGDNLKEILYGIKKHIFNKYSSLPLKIRQAFANSFFQTAKYAYIAYRQEYGFGTRGQFLEDTFIDMNRRNLENVVRNQVDVFRTRPSLLTNVLNKHGINVDVKDGIATITFDKSYGHPFSVTVTQDGDTISIRKNDADNVNDESFIVLIQDLLQELMPNDYNDILIGMSVNAPVQATLFGTFIDPISIILAASADKNDEIFSFDPETELLKTYPFKDYFSQSGKFLSIKNGINDLNVLKNGEGNNLPIYQLSPAIFDVFDVIDNIYDAGIPGKSVSSIELENIVTKNPNDRIGKLAINSVYGGNLFIKDPQLLKRITARSDIKIGNKVKSSDKLTPLEVVSLAIFNDFYQNLVTPASDDPMHGCIALQPITYSDKKTHFLPIIEISRLKFQIGKEIISGDDVFRNIINPTISQSKRQQCINAVISQIASTRGDKVKKQLWNQYLRFYKVFSSNVNYDNVQFVTKDGIVVNDPKSLVLYGTDFIRQLDFNTFNPDQAFKYVARILSNLNQFNNPLSIIRQMFKNEGALLSEDFDITILKDGNLQANESVYFNYKVFNVNDQSNLISYLTSQKLLFALDLLGEGFSLDIFEHPELKNYIEGFPKSSGNFIADDWLDSRSGIMKAARFFEKTPNGGLVEFTPTQAQIDDNTFRHRTDITVQLNPMVEGFFYANALLGNQINEIELGGTEGYVAKGTKPINFFENETTLLSQIMPIMAARLANEFKRTTYEGAIKRAFKPGLKFGVDAKIRTAIMDDYEPKISTLRGDTDKMTSQDGAGWTSPILHRMQLESLVDAPAGEVKKTIAGWNDPRTGTQNHFKWAETAITVGMRQRSNSSEKGSAEARYRKMHNQYDISDKIKAIKDFSVYYNPEDKNKVYNVQEHQITTTDYIYRYDLNDGFYERLDNVKLENGFAVTTWTIVDKHGTPVYKDQQPITRTSDPIKINTLYDLDQALGGAFVFALNEDGSFSPSEAVHDILYNVVCMNDMKTDFVGYMVNHSAAKAGAVNVNSYDSLIKDNVSLNTFYIAASGIGVQMNADHEMDFTSVTEMGQMISLLTQGGYNVDIVNRAYEDIGRVAAEAMRKITASVNSDDASIYRIIGKALLDTFDSGTKEELGLAQAFIRNAQNAILKETGKNDIILPYSAESVRGSFVSAVMSLINKSGIRRKYAGFGAVQVPAEGVMTTYRYNNIDYNYVGLRDAIRPKLKQYGITWEQASNEVIINGQLNPFLIPTNKKDVGFEDTVVIRNIDGTLSEPIKIISFKQLDNIRNLSESSVYRWELKSRELTQSDIKLTLYEDSPLGTITHNLSEWDIDPVRASFYLQELIDYKKNSVKNLDWLSDTTRKLNVIKSAISDLDLVTRNGFKVANIEDVENLSISFLENLRKLCVTKAQNFFNEISDAAKSGKPITINAPMSVLNDDFNRLGTKVTVSQNFQNVVAKVVIGRRNFDKYLLRKGDKLSDIKSKGWEFFYDRLKDKTGVIDKVRHQIPISRYDGVLNLSNGDNILVLVGEQGDNLQHFGKNQDFVISDDAVAYKGKVLFDNSKLKGLTNIKDLNFMSYITSTGETIGVIHVPDFDTFNRIRRSENVITSQYNYNSANYVDILKYKFADNFDSEGNLIKDIVIGRTSITPNTILTTDDLWNELNKTESYQRNSALQDKAKLMYRNFIHQLNFIQTRIPAQAMQSTMNIEVVDFADTDTTYIWVPKMLMLLQGSDLDIDKAYCIAYDVDSSGGIYSLSDLINENRYDVDDILLLNTPTYGAVRLNSSDNEYAVKVDFTEKLAELVENKSTPIKYVQAILDLFKNNPGETINLIVNTDDPRIKNSILVLKSVIKDVNIHEQSYRSEVETEHALRNQVLAAARKVMNDPASQLNAYTPIAMNEPRAAAELNTALGSKEKEMTLDNPMSIFVMQKQNMSGKEVIAMTATGIKSYFIVTTYFNTLVKELERSIRNYAESNDPNLANRIVEILNEITFNGKLDSKTVLRTFANINFYEIKKLLLEHPELSEITYTKDYEHNKANDVFEKYANSSTLYLGKLIDDLDYRANGNTWVIKDDRFKKLISLIASTTGEDLDEDRAKEILFDESVRNQFISQHPMQAEEINKILKDTDFYEYFTINAPDSLSALLSAATDNAKELILDKLNATAKFADIYITLLAQGVPFMSIATMMTNSAFRIAAKYAQDNIFDSNTSMFGIENALGFVLNTNQLSNIQRGLFEAYLVDPAPASNSHIHTGFFNLISGIKLNDSEVTISDLIYKDLIEKIPEDTINDFVASEGRTASTLLGNTTAKSKLETILLSRKNNSWKLIIAKSILDLFNDDKNKVNGVPLSTHLLNVLVDALKSNIDSYRNKTVVASDLTQEPEEIEFDPVEAIFDGDEEDVLAAMSEISSRDTGWYKGFIGKNELTKIYRYVQKYFKPKTESWMALTEKDRNKAKSDFEKVRIDVLYATKEMKMLGALGSINQGLKAKDFDEYNFVARVNKFVNQAYIGRGNGEIKEEFDLIKYITDKDYHDRHVKYYDKIKSSINILRAIDYTGNFKEMFNYIAVGRKMIEKSAAIKMERALINKLLHECNKTDSNSGINFGAMKSVSPQEFKVISQYIRDSIVLNFFLRRNDIKITVPAGQQFYHTNTTTSEPTLSPGLTTEKTITLNNIVDLATFKHLMDWYIIPKLILDPRFKDNAFIKNLQLTRYPDLKSRAAIKSYRLNAPLINIGDSPKAKQVYSKILSDLNNILYTPVENNKKEYKIGDWTIGNLFYVYNLIVNKDRISSSAMTRVFEDLISSGNKYSLASEYYQYISKLDKNEINIFDKDGQLNPDEFLYDLSDLRYRLSDSPYAESKFGVKEDKYGRKVNNVIFIDPETNVEVSEEVSDDSIKLSDFILGLPFATKLNAFIKPKTDLSSNFNSSEIVVASSESVFTALTEELADTYGKEIPVEILNNDEIDTEFADRTDEEKENMKLASGFIVNGNIYLNKSNMSLDAPMHEIMHFIAASMKFNADPKVRSSYYKLLDWVSNWVDNKINTGNKDLEDLKKKLVDKSGQYGNRHMSDIKEEILVTLLARTFADKFASEWGDGRNITKQFIQANIKKTLSSVLNSDDIVDVDFNELGNSKLISVFKKFASQILGMDSTLLRLNVGYNQEMADLKDFLIKNGLITLSEDCL